MILRTRSRTLSWGLAVITVLSLAFVISAPISAESAVNRFVVPMRPDGEQHTRYKLFDLGTLGGPNSWVCEGGTAICAPSQILNNQGTVVGYADTSTRDPFPAFCFNGFTRFSPPDCFMERAFEERNGLKAPLSALGRGSAAAVWVSDNGLVAGIAQNGATDPSVPGFPELRAVLWSEGQIVNLGTLGGNESLANTVNNRGEVVGASLNAIPDPFSFIDGFLGASNPTQTRAYVWQNGVMRDLGTLGGPDAFAIYVNQRGQIAGYSYTDSTPNADTGIPTVHPFLWHRGNMRDLGTLGGTQIPVLDGLNERGEVVGAMALAGNQASHPFLWDGNRLIDLGTFGGPGGDAGTINDAGEVVGWGGTTEFCPFLEGGGQHSFLWRKGVKIDLGAVPGTDNSDATWINSRTQVVGDSFKCDFSVVNAYLWEKGSIVDLNTLITTYSTLHLFFAANINDRGEIAGLASLPNGDIHAFVLMPLEDNEGGAVSSTRGIKSSTAPASRNLTWAEITAIRAVLAHRHLGFWRWRQR